MAIIRQTNKKTGITYVIDSESYWDKEKQQPRSHRTIIGKVDPETGEVVPTKKYNREKTSSSHAQHQGTASADGVTETGRISELEKEIAELRKEKEELIRDLQDVLKRHNG